MAEADITGNTPFKNPILLHLHTGSIGMLPEHLQDSIYERIDALDRFAKNPTDPTLWSQVTQKALEEDARDESQPNGLHDIPTQELVDFASVVIQTPPKDKYALTTELTSNGKRWFDVLFGFHSPSGSAAIEAAANFHTTANGQPKVATALDLATGTGKTARVVAAFAEHTIGLDRDGALLQVAQADNPNIAFVQGSLDALPFADASMDIITSDGIKYTLDKATSTAMYREIARVLKPGGVYIDTELADPSCITYSTGWGVNNPDVHPEILKTFVTWKAVLEDMIVDTISGKVEESNHMDLSGEEWNAFMNELGLREEYLSAHPRAINKWSNARMLHKA